MKFNYDYFLIIYSGVTVPCALGGSIIGMLLGYHWTIGMFIGIVIGFITAIVVTFIDAKRETKQQTN